MEFPVFAIPDDRGTAPAPAAEPTAPVSAGAPRGGAAPPSPEPTGVSAAPGTPPPPPAEELLPKYRYDEAVAARQAAERRLDQMAGLVQRVLAEQQAGVGAPPAPALDPEEQERRARIAQQLEDVLPGLGEIVSLRQHLPEIRAMLGYTKSQQRATQESLAQYNQYSLRRVADSLAPLVLGEKTPQGQPVTGAHLSAVQFGVVRQAFIEWLGDTAERRERYDRGDEELRDEFKTYFEQHWIAPLRRDQVVSAAQRQQRTNKLPVAGTSSAPVTSGPPKIDFADEDAVYKRAWEDTQASLRSAG